MEISIEKQKLLMKHRELGETEHPSPLPEDFLLIPKAERCKHNIPLFVKCTKCWIENGGKLCEHGYPEGYCDKCDEIEKKGNYLKERLDHPERWFKKYNIPPFYRGCSLDNFENSRNLVSYCREYMKGGLIFFGVTGCGKTHLAIGIMRELIRADKTGMWFETAPDLLMKIRACFQEGAEETEMEIVDRYSSIPFLVLDDLGSEKFSGFSMATFYLILDHRHSNELSTIITTNVPAEKFEDMFGSRIASRMAGMETIEILMPDYRKKRKGLNLD